ncbi:ABC-2 type transport system permease protein [Chitinophaga terrae (ex Kim and Jung 2007)]|uniref:Gldg family protein n=1 Tax=Chitinophaga terrae (ex Kim and Jung 2007) TaxID=408074 RepID=UPI00277F89FD|nr:Gldg family protein [Chitinophaga terrae (ex Kim and Jung 2007)]MDQ0106758.1 ABC-2 type transport system permease protein [Chitinophaga terrae (ex Kim and Jung 2007)]
MRRIYKIAKAELFTLFYSPIAWMILVVFTFQTGMVFTGLLQQVLRSQETGFGNAFITANIYTGQLGLLTAVQNYLYLYMPLLTMGLMSRELSSGSIKLLYSSPVTSSQIIRGKFLAMMIYSFLLLSVILVYVVISMFYVEHFDLPSVLSGLLGIYLLMCAYAAIGLFMSSLTSYQVVAALGTLVLLAALSYMNKVWQDISFVRDITYWLSISGRCNEMINGLICSEDVLYFVIVIVMFLTLSIQKLQANRTHQPFALVWGKYSLVVLAAMALGYATSRPVLMAYYDATATKRNTLTPNSQAIMAKLTGGLTITTYVNLLDREFYNGKPSVVNEDKDRLKQYIRFKPEMKLKYVYYYDEPSNNPRLNFVYKGKSLAEMAKREAEIGEYDLDMFLTPAEIRKKINLKDEGNTFVRLVERENGQKAWLRIYDDIFKFPGEAEVSAMFKRMVMKLPRIGFLDGQGERKIEGDRAKDYTLFSSVKTFRYALTNQGCDVESLDLSGDKQIPKEVDIIVIADMKEAMDSTVKKKLDAYIAAGGNLFLTLKPGSEEMEKFIAQFGLKTVPGQLVQPKQDVAGNVVMCVPTNAAKGLAEIFKMMEQRHQYVGMVKAAGLELAEDKGFKATPIMRTIDTMKTWNEVKTIDFVNDSATYDPSAGERLDSFVTVMALTRKVGAKEQRIMVLGDADCISNEGMTPPIRRYGTANFSLIPGTFHWLSYGTVPVDVSRPPSLDNETTLTKASLKVVKYSLLYVLPGLLLIGSSILLIRRKRK